MRNLIPAIVAIVIATVAPAVAAGPCDHPEIVRRVETRGGSAPRMLTDAQILKEIAEISLKAGVTTPFACEYEPGVVSNVFPVVSANPRGQSRIMIPRGVQKIFSPKGLRGVLAHEVAHIVLRHGGIIPMLAEDIRREMEADKFAATWVGEEAVLAFLEEAGVYYGQILGDAVLRRLQPRITAAKRRWVS